MSDDKEFDEAFDAFQDYLLGLAHEDIVRRHDQARKTGCCFEHVTEAMAKSHLAIAVGYAWSAVMAVNAHDPDKKGVVAEFRKRSHALLDGILNTLEQEDTKEFKFNEDLPRH